jgi:hypothetical protein
VWDGDVSRDDLLLKGDAPHGPNTSRVRPHGRPLQERSTDLGWARDAGIEVLSVPSPWEGVEKASREGSGREFSMGGRRDWIILTGQHERGDRTVYRRFLPWRD